MPTLTTVGRNGTMFAYDHSGFWMTINMRGQLYQCIRHKLVIGIQE
tara:strand:- start:134298 stop:134435 length:138 start_codon:yes stop_codon:yes gene_type:complete